MKNKELRAELLEEGTYRNYTQRRKEAFRDFLFDDMYREVQKVDERTGEIDCSKVLNAAFFGIEEDTLEECEKIRKCKNEQRKKVEEHVKYILSKDYYDTFFLTFTFSDETLKKTSAGTRKQKVRRILGSCEDYILNIDYGEKNGREHYHAIASWRKGSVKVTSDVEFEHDGMLKKGYKLDALEGYSYGFYSALKVDKGADKSAEKLARYITKLTMHSIKVAQSYVSVKKGSEYQTFKKKREKFSNALKKRQEEPMEARLEDYVTIAEWPNVRDGDIHGLLTEWMKRQVEKAEPVRML